MPSSVLVDDSVVRQLRAAWCAETSASSTWSVASPASGQCAVTALIIQDLHGGELVRGVVEGVSHYWNRIGEAEVDITREQFHDFDVTDVDTRERSYLMSSRDTRRRYGLLRRRFELAQGV